jgi:hypothetical protein
MAALVRYSIDGWPMSQAVDEATRYRRQSMLHPSLTQAQREFLARWAASHPRGGVRPTAAPARETTGGSS